MLQWLSLVCGLHSFCITSVAILVFLETEEPTFGCDDGAVEDILIGSD